MRRRSRLNGKPNSMFGVRCSQVHGKGTRRFRTHRLIYFTPSDFWPLPTLDLTAHTTYCHSASREHSSLSPTVGVWKRPAPLRDLTLCEL